MFKQKRVVETGIVKYIQGDYATIEIKKVNPEECKSCGACTSMENNANFLEVKTIPGLSTGKEVKLQIVRQSIYKSIILLFFLPIVSLIVGSLIGRKVYIIFPDSQNLRMLFGGFVLFVLSIFVVSMYEKKVRSKRQIDKRIISIVN
jgi:positive regulator of sigma E activity